MKIFSKNTWGVDVNNAWPLTTQINKSLLNNILGIFVGNKKLYFIKI